MWTPSEVIDEMWRWIPTTGARAIYLLSWFYEPASILELSGKSLMDRGVVSKTCDMLESRGWMKMVRFQGKLRPTALVPTQCQEVMATRLQEGFEMAFDRGDFLAGKRLQWCLKTDDYVANAGPPCFQRMPIAERLQCTRYYERVAKAVPRLARHYLDKDGPYFETLSSLSQTYIEESSSETFAEGAGEPSISSYEEIEGDLKVFLEPPPKT